MNIDEQIDKERLRQAEIETDMVLLRKDHLKQELYSSLSLKRNSNKIWNYIAQIFTVAILSIGVGFGIYFYFRNLPPEPIGECFDSFSSIRESVASTNDSEYVCEHPNARIEIETPIFESDGDIKVTRITCKCVNKQPVLKNETSSTPLLQ